MGFDRHGEAHCDACGGYVLTVLRQVGYENVDGIGDAVWCAKCRKGSLLVYPTPWEYSDEASRHQGTEVWTSPAG